LRSTFWYFIPSSRTSSTLLVLLIFCIYSFKGNHFLCSNTTWWRSIIKVTKITGINRFEPSTCELFGSDMDWIFHGNNYARFP
jgi:hypothetical protein